MKINHIYKQLINETENKHTYGCVMLFLDAKSTEFKKVQKLIKEEDLYLGTDEDPGYGRETEPHVTILYGIHNDVPDKDVKELCDKMTAPELVLENITLFDNPDFDVVKFDVKNADLTKYNKMFTELPHTTKYPDYHAHVTIAYVKPGKGEQYVQKLAEKIIVKPNYIVYSKADDSKKTYKF